jgi:hypothetical protein
LIASRESGRFHKTPIPENGVLARARRSAFYIIGLHLRCASRVAARIVEVRNRGEADAAEHGLSLAHMKNKTQSSIALKVRFGSVYSTLLLVFSVLLGGSGERCAAQIFPAQGDDTTFSIGIFRLMIAPAFRPLLAPAVGTNGYPGYRSSDGRLTSPMMFDPATTIGRSSRHDRLLVGSVPVGIPSMGNVGYADYPAIPFLWAAAPAPTEEILTQIRSFALVSESRVDQCPTNDPRVPQIPLSWLMVKAGPAQGVTRKSLGMVQEDVAGGAALGAANPDFPARSFFDIFVEVNLPQVLSTYSITAFPGTGAALYNDIPLIITNLNLTTLPPSVVYIHGETTAVPLKFKVANPPFWNADDVFGYLVLAGHGTFTNDCNSEAALVNAVLGPLGTSNPEMAVEWPVPGNLCPTPGTTYDSVKDDDVIKFTILGAGTIRTRNFVHGNLGNPIVPPPLNGTSAYQSPNTFVTLELSLDGQTWIPAQASGGVQTRITHKSDTGSTGFFETEMLALSLNGNGPFGPFMIRESPTKQSLGKHTLRSSTQGFLVSSFFDVFLELSTDGGQSWIPADRSIRVQVGNPPCGALGAHPVVTKSGNSVIVSWSDPTYRLQYSDSLTSTGWTDLAGATSPATFPVNNAPLYFRLICP